MPATKSVPSARVIGAAIIRTERETNDQFFAMRRRDYHAAVLAAAEGREIDPQQFGQLTFDLAISPEQWVKDIEREELRIRLHVEAAQQEGREHAAAQLEEEINRFDLEEGQRHRSALQKLDAMREQLRLAIDAVGNSLEARDKLRQMRPTTADELDLQRQLTGTDRCDASGFIVLGHDDGLLDRIRQVERALDPNGFNGPSYVQPTCADFPAWTIRQTEAELAQLRKSPVEIPADRYARLERRLVVAKGCLEMKRAELADLRRMEAGILQKQAAVAEASANQ